MNFLKTACLFLVPFSLSAQNYYGGIPALFDDFSYTNTEFPIAGDSSNSLYGRNIWLTEKGRTSSRAWHRYNWGDGDNFGKNSAIESSRYGISLSAFKGFRIGDITPIVPSGFLLKEGTYVSRVRCSALTPQANAIQAFWLFTPDSYRFKNGNDSVSYFNEVDFEWNNWFTGRGEKRVYGTTIGMHDRKKGLYSKGVEMRFFQQAESGQFLDIGTKVDDTPEYYFENRWYYYLIRLDGNRHTTEFLMESAEEDNIAMEKVFAGSERTESGSIAPVNITEYYPLRPLMTVYNLGLGVLDNQDSLLKTDLKMDVDWFYFTPQTDIEISEIVQEVQNLRFQNIMRLNTAGAQLDHDISKPHTTIISGPSTIRSGQSGQWKVEPSVKNTTFDIEFSYRLVSKENQGKWIEISTPEISLTAGNNTSQIEFRATVKNFWTKETVSATKIVEVLP